ncbi:hypothetical protein HDU86_000591 [Geranomyces michiganensis]|nr:hypothetical protein HDU86_000591 [Geranomyces michiganensis]
MPLSPRDPSAAYYAPSRRRQFSSVGAIDAYAAKSPSYQSPRSPTNPSAHLRTVALAYFDASAYSKAERFLRQYLDAVDQDDLEVCDAQAMEALACTYDKLNKPVPALALYRQLLQTRPKSVSLALGVVRLSLYLARTEDKSRMCQIVTSALRILQRCQDVNQKIATEVLLALDETYKFVAQNCPECAVPTQLLPDLLATAGLYETKRRESLHIWLVRAILDSGVAESAWSYVTAHRQELGDSLIWLNILKARFTDLERGCTSSLRNLDIAELHLWLHAAIIQQIFERDEHFSPGDLQELLAAFEQRLDATSALLPLPDANATTLWVSMRSEYTATLIMLRALYDSRAIANELHIISDITNCRPLIDEALSKWRLCLTYRELHRDYRLNQQAVQRLSMAGHKLLAILLCLESGGLSAVKYAGSAKFGDLPLLRIADLAGAHLAKDIKSSLSWIQNDRLFLIDRDCFATSPWNLGRFATAAALYFSTDRLRMLLREIFPDMPESPTRNVGFDGARPTLTIADMEAFILRLLIRQTWWASAVKMANPREAVFIACIGSWTPSAAQDGFWRTAIATNGKKTLQCRHERVLDDEELSMWISEIRGAPPRDVADAATIADKRNLCGRLGLLYADLAKDQSYREADARRYLEAWKNWDCEAIAVREVGHLASKNPTIPDVAQDDVDQALRAIIHDRGDIIRKKSPLPLQVTPLSGHRRQLDALSEETPGSTSPPAKEAPASPSPAPKAARPATPASSVHVDEAPKEVAEVEFPKPPPQEVKDHAPSTPEPTAQPVRMFSSARAQRHLRSLNELRKPESAESISSMLTSSPIKPRRSLLDLLGTREPATPAKSAQPPSLSASILMSTPTAANTRPILRAPFTPLVGSATPDSPVGQRVAAVAAETTIIVPPRSPLGFAPRNRSAPPVSPAPPAVKTFTPEMMAGTAAATMPVQEDVTASVVMPGPGFPAPSETLETADKAETPTKLEMAEIPAKIEAPTTPLTVTTANVDPPAALSMRPLFRRPSLARVAAPDNDHFTPKRRAEVVTLRRKGLVTQLSARFGGADSETAADEGVTVAKAGKQAPAAAEPLTPTKIGARLERQMAMLETYRQATPKDKSALFKRSTFNSSTKHNVGMEEPAAR